MTNDKFVQNIKNYVERGDCGHEGLEYQFEDSDNILYFANNSTNDYPVQTHSEMYVYLKPQNPMAIKFEYIIPGKYRDIQEVPVEQFITQIY